MFLTNKNNQTDHCTNCAQCGSRLTFAVKIKSEIQSSKGNTILLISEASLSVCSLPRFHIGRIF